MRVSTHSRNNNIKRERLCWWMRARLEMNKNHWGGLLSARRRLVLSLVSKSNTRPKRMSPEQKCVIDDGGCGAESEAVVVGESVQPHGWAALCTRGKLPKQIASRSAGGSSQHRTGGPCHGPLVIIAKDTHLTEDDVLLFLQSFSRHRPRNSLYSRTPMPINIIDRATLFSFILFLSLSAQQQQQHKTDQGMCYNDWH